MKILIILLTMSFNLYGQIVLEDVVHSQKVSDDEIIEAEYTPLKENIYSEQIERNQVSSMDDLLRLTPGATTSRGPRSNSESPQVRGLESDKLAITVDGVTRSFQQGHSTMIPINFDEMKSVEVDKTNLDLSLSNSISGGIKFTSKTPADYLKGNKKTVTVFKKRYSSANREDATFAKTAFKVGAASSLLSLNRTSAADMRLNNGQTLENSAFEDLNAENKWSYRNFVFSLKYFERNEQTPLDPTLNPPGSLQSLIGDSQIKITTANLQYKKENFKVSLHQERTESLKIREEDNREDYRNLETTGLKVDQQIKNISFGMELTADSLSSTRSIKSISTAGVVDPDGISSFPKASSLYQMAYIQPSFKLSESETLTGGLKINHYQMRSPNFDQKEGSYISKSLAFESKFTENLTGALTYAEGFNSPRVYQVYPEGLHNRGDGFFIKDNFFIPNEELTHEISNQRQVSLSYDKFIEKVGAKLSLSASYFENDVQDYIISERIDRTGAELEDGSTQFVNIPSARIYGHELSANYLFDIYELSMQYNQVRGRNLTQNLWLEDFPADFYTVNFRAFVDKYALTLGTRITHTLSQNRINPETFQRTDATPAYTLQDVFATKQIDNFSLALSVQNLGNKKYRRHASHLFESREDVRLSVTYQVDTI